MPVLGHHVRVVPGDRTIRGTSPASVAFLERARDLAPTVILRYLTSVRAIPLAGTLIAPRSLEGGLIFTSGAHRLPLEAVARAFQPDPARLARKCEALGGVPEPHADVSARLFPLPRVPVVVIFRAGDAEFPPSVALFFDASAPRHLRTDGLWGAAMLCVRALLA